MNMKKFQVKYLKKDYKDEIIFAKDIEAVRQKIIRNYGYCQLFQLKSIEEIKE